MVDVCPLSCYFFRGSIFDGDEIIKEAHIKRNSLLMIYTRSVPKLLQRPKFWFSQQLGIPLIFV